MTAPRTRLLSIVVVSYNTREATLACLDSVERGGLTTPFELVVVDNASHDGSAAAIVGRFPDATVVEAGANLGFAAGVDLGVERSRGDRVLLLNPDTLVLPGSLQRLVDFADAHPDYGVYGGRTLRPDGTVDPSSCWGAPSLWSLACFAAGLTTAFRRSRLFDPESLGRWERDSVREVPIVTGCLLAISRADWDRLGGMDERYFLYGEDADFSLRARASGLRPVIVPDAVIVHEVGGSTGSGGRKLSLVLAGKVTLLEGHWGARRAALGIRMLETGVRLRAALERRRGVDDHWAIVESQREDWRVGYPEARRTLFGLPVEAVR